MGSTSVDRTHLHGEELSRGRDWIAVEEPLEILIGNETFAVVMRTPGHDTELATGLLYTERAIHRPEDIASIHAHSRARDPDEDDHAIRVVTAPGVEIDFESLRRNLYASSSCGICGKATIENALDTHPPIEDDVKFSPALFHALPERLREAQVLFAKTGGLHAAGLFDGEGKLQVLREDVGRHNAVDKVIGWSLRSQGLPLAGTILMVSGRVSYEIVQKALAARIPVLAAVSAPTSLAVDLAQSGGITLVGFLRDGALNIYAHGERIDTSAAMGPREPRS